MHRCPLRLATRLVQNHPASDKPHARNNPLHDPAQPFAVLLQNAKLYRDEHEKSGSQANQHIGSDTRRLAANLPLNSQKPPSQQRHSQSGNQFPLPNGS